MESTMKKKWNLQALLAPLALVILYVFFSIFGNNFFSVDMLKNILESSYYIGFMAFGVTFVIITGGIDLSIGTVMMCSALLGAFVFKEHQWPLALALVLTVGVGTAFGFANGLLVACREGQLRLELLQLPGKKAMNVGDILRGHPDLFTVGAQLECPSC